MFFFFSLDHSAFSDCSLPALLLLLTMASQDYISQFSQGIPATQPDRSPSRTPHRDLPAQAYGAPVPTFRGPQQSSPPTMSWPYTSPSLSQVQPFFPPVPPAYPPPPPPLGSTTPQRFTLYYVTEISFSNYTARNFPDQQGLPGSPLRNSSYAKLETGR